MKITGSEAVIRSLINENVDVIFGYPGGAIMPIYDALYHFTDRIRHILVRHEQGATHAAEGYARLTGKAGVCMATSGPGATNLVTGIADAMMDSVPMVCITGQVHISVLGTDAFQEADVIGITTPITKWNYQITKPQEIPEIFAKAFYIAQSGRPGPVVIDITKNAQFEEMDFSYKKVTQLAHVDIKEPDEKTVGQAIELLNTAKKPYILAGHGVLISRAQNELLQLAEKINAPVAVTLHGLSSFPTDHPLYAGMLGMHGNYSPNVLTNEADVILAVGMRFDDRVTGKLSAYAPNARIIHIDIDPAELNKNVPTMVSIAGDAAAILKTIGEKVEKNSHDIWNSQFKNLDTQEYEKVIKYEISPETGSIKMGEAIHMLSQKTNGEAVIVADVGQNQMMAARYYRFKKTDGYITSGGSGTMGFAVPAAIGAKIAAPDRQVVAVTGDGGFQMTIQELGTIMQENLPVKILILNNNYLGMVRQWQELFFEKRYSFVDLKNPDFVQIAKGFSINAERVSERKELDAAMDRFLASEKPFILEVVVEKKQNVFPMMPAGAAVNEMRLE